MWDSVSLIYFICIPKPKSILVEWNHVNLIMHAVRWAWPVERKCKTDRWLSGSRIAPIFSHFFWFRAYITTMTRKSHIWGPNSGRVLKTNVTLFTILPWSAPLKHAAYVRNLCMRVHMCSVRGGCSCVTIPNFNSYFNYIFFKPAVTRKGNK